MLSYAGNIHLSCNVPFCISGEWCSSGPGLPPTTRVDEGQLYRGEGAKRCSADGGASIYRYLGGGFKYFLFPPLPGEDSHFD